MAEFSAKEFVKNRFDQEPMQKKALASYVKKREGAAEAHSAASEKKKASGAAEAEKKAEKAAKRPGRYYVNSAGTKVLIK